MYFLANWFIKFKSTDSLPIPILSWPSTDSESDSDFSNFEFNYVYNMPNKQCS
jgi:hypothetical protein